MRSVASVAQNRLSHSKLSLIVAVAGLFGVLAPSATLLRADPSLIRVVGFVYFLVGALVAWHINTDRSSTLTRVLTVVVMGAGGLFVARSLWAPHSSQWTVYSPLLLPTTVGFVYSLAVFIPLMLGSANSFNTYAAAVALLVGVFIVGASLETSTFSASAPVKAFVGTAQTLVVGVPLAAPGLEWRFHNE
jgi:cation transport ATPase